MGMSESGMRIFISPFNACVSDVLGSFDYTCKSKCCENYKFCSCYSHCRTNNMGEKEDDDDNKEDTEIVIE
jgi:hypothetical protein